MPAHKLTANTSTRPTRRRRGSLVLAAAGLVLVASAPHANAEGMEASQVGTELVQQALSLIANDAGTARIAEKVQTAIEAPDLTGVDLLTLQQALTTLQTDPGPSTVERARLLLIAAAPGLASPSHPPLAVGGDTGTTAVLAEFKPLRGIAGTSDAVLLSLALLAVASGLLLSRHLRPPHSLRELRRRSATREAQG